MINETPDSTARLLKALDSPDKPTIRAAVDALIPLAARSPDLKAALNQLLMNRYCQNPWSAAYVLGHLPRPSQAVIQALLAGLDHHEPDIRWAIALLLIRLAKADDALVTLLAELCTAGTSVQKRMAVYCVRDLKLTDAATLQALLKSLCDSDPSVRVAAAISLKARTDIAAPGRQALLQLFLNDPDAKVRNAAAITLAHLGSPSEEFVAALNRAGESENAQIKKAATAALDILQNKKVRSNR
jgi:HEAT repeat protein